MQFQSLKRQSTRKEHQLVTGALETTMQQIGRLRYGFRLVENRSILRQKRYNSNEVAEGTVPLSCIYVEELRHGGSSRR